MHSLIYLISFVHGWLAGRLWRAVDARRPSLRPVAAPVRRRRPF